MFCTQEISFQSEHPLQCDSGHMANPRKRTNVNSLIVVINERSWPELKILDELLENHREKLEITKQNQDHAKEIIGKFFSLKCSDLCWKATHSALDNKLNEGQIKLLSNRTMKRPQPTVNYQLLCNLPDSSPFLMIRRQQRKAKL